MNDLREIYFTMQRNLFPMVEEELGEITAKMKEFLLGIELMKPSRFIKGALCWSGQGRPMANREHLFRAFYLKTVYSYPTTKVLIDNLETNSKLRLLCGWEHRGEVPSEATFSRAFGEFAAQKLLCVAHEAVISENYDKRLVGHANTDSTAIIGREKACRKNTPRPKLKKKCGRKSKAELETMKAQQTEEIRTRRLALQGNRSLEENLADLPTCCDWGGKRNSKGVPEYWTGFKFHLTFGDGGVPIAAILTSASVHDSQVAIPLMQMAAGRGVTVLYDLQDSAYDAPEIKMFSKSLGHVPIIDPNKRRGEEAELSPAEKIRFHERSTAERGNSELKDNYGARNIRVKGHGKVLCHLMFGILALTVKTLFNML